MTTMIANGNRAQRAHSRATRRADETPYDLVVVCLGFVFGVAVTALFIWLALGGQL
ncbi:MAG: hypothetical protein WBL84_14930 [Xanthobacteraceae bacterium]